METKPALDRSNNTITTGRTSCQLRGVKPLDGSAVARRIVRAELSLTTGNAQTCAKEARSVLASDATHVGALEVLAKALWQACDFAALLPVLERLITLNPYEPGYHALRGAAYQSMGRYGDAVRSLARVEAQTGPNQALHELQAYQADLIAALLTEDAVFRAHYAQDPEAACLTRGFAFASVATGETWIADKGAAATLHVRPS